MCDVRAVVNYKLLFVWGQQYIKKVFLMEIDYGMQFKHLDLEKDT